MHRRLLILGFIPERGARLPDIARQLEDETAKATKV